MCGIVGIIRQGTKDPLPELKASVSKLAHRGPDDTGIWSQSYGRRFTVGLGHVRLSVLDLSSKGHQPMVANDQSVIIFNGEIYNYLELKEKLKRLGHDFSTNSDTEVILAAYKEWGKDCVEDFIGMWAFAIWDGEQLFLSRDRLGKKPLYMYQDTTAGFLAFASEIKALREITGVPWQPDERTVFHYLAFGEMERKGNTFFKGIRELPPASIYFYVPGERQARWSCFWSLSDEEHDVDEQEAITKTSELLYDSVRLRLRSDAPFGLSLSGGLDSTLLLALMNEAGMSAPPVFSSAYEEHGYNETTYINLATRNMGCKPNSTVSSASLFHQDFESFIYHLDQPSKLPGPYSQWRVAELAGRNVKVLIDGQGADELAGGYMYFLPLLWRETSLSKKLCQMPDLLLTTWANRHIFNQHSLLMIWERFQGQTRDRNFLPLKPDWTDRFTEERPAWGKHTHLNPMLRQSITDTSLPALLRYGDRVNMAFGVENRCPFLDHRLVGYVSALPPQMKIRGGTTKWIFRAVAGKRIPDAILKRRLKMGFPTPVGSWFRRKLLKATRQRFIQYSDLQRFNQWISIDGVLKLLNEHASRKADHHALLWRLLSLGAWLKTAEVE